MGDEVQKLHVKLKQEQQRWDRECVAREKQQVNAKSTSWLSSPFPHWPHLQENKNCFRYYFHSLLSSCLVSWKLSPSHPCFQSEQESLLEEREQRCLLEAERLRGEREQLEAQLLEYQQNMDRLREGQRSVEMEKERVEAQQRVLQSWRHNRQSSLPVTIPLDEYKVRKEDEHWRCGADALLTALRPPSRCPLTAARAAWMAGVPCTQTKPCWPPWTRTSSASRLTTTTTSSRFCRGRTWMAACTAPATPLTWAWAPACTTASTPCWVRRTTNKPRTVWPTQTTPRATAAPGLSTTPLGSPHRRREQPWVREPLSAGL